MDAGISAFQVQDFSLATDELGGEIETGADSSNENLVFEGKAIDDRLKTIIGHGEEMH